MKRLIARDESAFTELVRAHHAALVRLAQVFVSSRAVAEEVAQETWVGVLSGLSRFEGRSSLKTWIFRILTNRAKTRGVREGRTVPFSSIESGSDDRGVGDPAQFNDKGGWATPQKRWDDDTPEKLVNRSETREMLEKAIDDLAPNQRAVVVMRDVHGFDSDDVCNILQISGTNQRVLLHRARKRLRDIIAADLAKLDAEAA